MPTKKTVESPIFFFEEICSFHITGWGRNKIKMSETELMELPSIIIVIVSMQVPSIHGFQNFFIGLQEYIVKKKPIK